MHASGPDTLIGRDDDVKDTGMDGPQLPRRTAQRRVGMRQVRAYALSNVVGISGIDKFGNFNNRALC